MESHSYNIIYKIKRKKQNNVHTQWFSGFLHSKPVCFRSLIPQYLTPRHNNILWVKLHVLFVGFFFVVVAPTIWYGLYVWWVANWAYDLWYRGANRLLASHRPTHKCAICAV